MMFEISVIKQKNMMIPMKRKENNGVMPASQNFVIYELLYCNIRIHLLCFVPKSFHTNLC